jgi:2-keto-4-pentenoate hydratase
VKKTVWRQIWKKLRLKKYAEYLNSAELNRKDVFRLTLENPDLTMDEGYEIQREIVKLKLAARAQAQRHEDGRHQRRSKWCR